MGRGNPESDALSIRSRGGGIVAKLEVGDRVYCYTSSNLTGDSIIILTVARLTPKQAVCNDRIKTKLWREYTIRETLGKTKGRVEVVGKHHGFGSPPEYLVESRETKQDLEKMRERIKHLQLIERAKAIPFDKLGQAKLKQILSIAGIK